MQNTKKGYIGYFIYNIFKDIEATTNPQQYQYFPNSTPLHIYKSILLFISLCRSGLSKEKCPPKHTAFVRGTIYRFDFLKSISATDARTTCFYPVNFDGGGAQVFDVFGVFGGVQGSV